MQFYFSLELQLGKKGKEKDKMKKMKKKKGKRKRRGEGVCAEKKTTRKRTSGRRQRRHGHEASSGGRCRQGRVFSCKKGSSSLACCCGCMWQVESSEASLEQFSPVFLALENGANLVAFSSELETPSFFLQQQQQLCVCFALVRAA